MPRHKAKRKIEFIEIDSNQNELTDREKAAAHLRMMTCPNEVPSGQDAALMNDFNKQASLFLRSMHPPGMSFAGGHPQPIYPPNFPNYYPPMQNFDKHE